MLKTIFTNWNFMRAIRLILGVFIIIQSFQSQQYLMIIPGVIFASMALFSVGCCGYNGCAIPTKKQENE
jgi:ABC-type polysaccharide/polyol phosphate export permease